VGQKRHRKSRGLYFSMEMGTKIINRGQKFFVHQRIVQAVKRVEFFSDRESHTVLRGRRCNIIVLNVHAATEEKRNDSRTVFISTISTK
jgi:hypothetical protein